MNQGVSVCQFTNQMRGDEQAPTVITFCRCNNLKIEVIYQSTATSILSQQNTVSLILTQ